MSIDARHNPDQLLGAVSDGASVKSDGSRSASVEGEPSFEKYSSLSMKLFSQGDSSIGATANEWSKMAQAETGQPNPEKDGKSGPAMTVMEILRRAGAQSPPEELSVERMKKEMQKQILKYKGIKIEKGNPFKPAETDDFYRAPEHYGREKRPERRPEKTDPAPLRKQGEHIQGRQSTRVLV